MIKYLVMDVDGTLTDGNIYMGDQGELIKAFDIKDGAGIALILPKEGIVPIIITARESKILENRCKELKISEVHQGSMDKLKTLTGVLKKYEADLSMVAYAGDDIPDIPCMEAVKNAGGLVVCPADAIPEVKALADFISCYKAGDGAIRDCINFMVQKNGESDVKERVKKVIDLILVEDFKEKPVGEYTLPDGTKYSIQEYETKREEDCVLETHRSHIDIQYMVSGREQFKTYITNCLISTGEYDVEKDAEYWQGGIEASHTILLPGSLIVVYNVQPHKGAIQVDEPERVKKVVGKIEV